MPTAYVYSRFSSIKQESGHSLKRQRDLAQKWLDTIGADLGVIEDHSLTLTDSGLSGYKGTHRSKGNLGIFLGMVLSGQIEEGSYLLVENLDRLSREELTTATTNLLSVVTNGVNVVTLTDNKIYSKETLNDGGMSFIGAIMYMARAHEESKLKSQRVAAAWRNKMKRVAEGVQLTKKVPFWISKDDKNQTIPEKVEIVQRIFALASKGIGDGTIAKTLNADSVPTPTGRSTGWGNSSIMKVRKSRNALGELQLADGSLHKGYYPAVVTEEQYLLANSKNDLATQPKTRDVNNTHPLTGLCVCSLCGRTATRSIKTGRTRKDGTRNRWHSLECSGAKRGTTPCPSHRISYKKILEAVLGAIWDHDYVEDISSQIMNLEGARDHIHDRLEIVKDLMAKDRFSSTLQKEYAELLETLGEIGKEEARLVEIGSTASRNSARKLKEQLFNERRVTSGAVMGLVKKVEINFLTEEITVTMRDGIVITPEEDSYNIL